MALSVGEIVNGKVTGITNFGAFVETEDGSRGMIHISEISRSYIEDIKSVLKIGQAVTVKVISVADDGKVALSMKQLEKADASKKPMQTKSPRLTVSRARANPKNRGRNMSRRLRSPHPVILSGRALRRADPLRT